MKIKRLTRKKCQLKNLPPRTALVTRLALTITKPKRQLPIATRSREFSSSTLDRHENMILFQV
ncbi:MAG: hypothetical protein ACTSSM_09185 [Promethearchaeota archaeon]